MKLNKKIRKTMKDAEKWKELKQIRHDCIDAGCSPDGVRKYLRDEIRGYRIFEPFEYAVSIALLSTVFYNDNKKEQVVFFKAFNSIYKYFCNYFRPSILEIRRKGKINRHLTGKESSALEEDLSDTTGISKFFKTNPFN